MGGAPERPSRIPGLEFRSAGEIVFGRGSISRLPAIAAGLGRRALLVRGGGHLDGAGALHALVEGPLAAAGVEAVAVSLRGEPDVEAVDLAAGEARAAGTDLVIGVGGGSVIDAAKAVSALVSNGGSALDYMEVVGKGRAIEARPLPMIAVPTTAGTGSEVTRNAVVTSKAPPFKASIRSSLMIPRVALVDPRLTDSMPPALTASTGLDALCQLVESYTTAKANPVTDALAMAGIRLAAGSLVAACRDGGDEGARDSMSLAALLSGLCLANSGLGAVHGIAAPLGASFPVPHGAACAALLPGVVEANVRALAALPDGGGLAGISRYAEIGSILIGGHATSGDPVERALACAGALRDLAATLAIPRLGSFGVAPSDAAVVAERALTSSSMKGNPVRLDMATLERVLAEAI